ncbi:MAG TPA: DNA repair protein RecN [Chitinophagales bacterium]|nr:DNA repair protein RecN [Chitinophagales bacterium]
MLQRLSINNYAIIDHLDISFSPNINIITGETGAGKSIIIGALSLILGERADSKTLFDERQKCVVEGTFDISRYRLKSFFREKDLDYDETSTVRREISPNGKSRSFINDTPVNLAVLRELGEQLVNLHSQHQTLALNNPQFQLELVDALAQHDKLLNTFLEKYQAYKKVQHEIQTLMEQNRHITDKDYLEFQFRELEDAGLKDDEQESLENELKALENAEEIKSALGKVSVLMQHDDFSVLNQLREVYSLLKSASAFHNGVSEISKRIDSSQIELRDVAAEIEKLGESVVYDGERISRLNARLDTLNRLQQKHRAQNVRELIAVRDSLAKKLKSFETLDVELSQKQKLLDELREEMTALGDKIHDNRQGKKPSIEKQVIALLKEVGMPNARFEVSVEKLPFEKVTPHGFNKITFLFSANKGNRMEELKSVASGGELSRLMLVLKSLLASGMAMPTLIFDEIDSGVSGETAIKVGALLSKLGKSHQVIAITHLPQIARAGETHFYVFKEDRDDKTVTRLRMLSEKERVVEIAKMIGGEKYSQRALESAKELLLG